MSFWTFYGHWVDAAAMIADFGLTGAALVQAERAEFQLVDHHQYRVDGYNETFGDGMIVFIDPADGELYEVSIAYGIDDGSGESLSQHLDWDPQVRADWTDVKGSRFLPWLKTGSTCEVWWVTRERSWAHQQAERFAA